MTIMGATVSITDDHSPYLCSLWILQLKYWLLLAPNLHFALHRERHVLPISKFQRIFCGENMKRNQSRLKGTIINSIMTISALYRAIMKSSQLETHLIIK